MLSRRAVLVSAVGLILITGAAQSQASRPAKPNPIMRGAVQDTLGHGLEGAQIEILGQNLVATTPGSGSYRLDNIKPGKYWVAVRRIGFAPFRTALTFSPGDDREIIFELQPLAHRLADVVVQGENKRWMRLYQDFVWRSHSSFGHFLTRDDVEKAHAAYLGDIVQRYLPFTTADAFFRPALNNGFLGTRTLADHALGRFGGSSSIRMGRNCSPAVSVNGARPMGGWAVNDFRPEDVEAMEVYRSIREMPMEFAGWDLPCGLVVVWTQRQ